MARQKSEDGSNLGASPVHQMLQSSHGLLAQIAHVGREKSRSSEALSGPQDSQRALETCDLLSRVIHLGRMEAQAQMSQQPNIPPTVPEIETTDINKELNILSEPNDDKSDSSKSKWGNLLGRKDTGRKYTSHQGKHYESVSTDENDSETDNERRLSKDSGEQTNSKEPLSPEFMSVTVETEESDLSNTLFTPDDGATALMDAPDLVAFANPAMTCKLSSSSSSSSSYGHHDTLLSSAGLSVGTHPHRSPPQHEAIELQTLDVRNLHQTLSSSLSLDAAAKPRPTAACYRIKSASFENPSLERDYLVMTDSILRKSRSEQLVHTNENSSNYIPDRCNTFIINLII